MVKSADDGDPPRFSVGEHLSDPAVRQGYEAQDAVVEAAALVRGMREAAGLSQTGLAARLGTSQAHLSMLERGVGRHGPTFLMLRKIADACGQMLDISVWPAGLPSRAPAAAVTPFRRAVRLQPLRDRIVVRRIAAEERVAGGIIIPDAAREKPAEGEVVAVGPEVGREGAAAAAGVALLDVRAGDRVLFGKSSGAEVKLGGEDLLIMNERDIMGIIEGDDRPARPPKPKP
jgi:chaperonin GroES